MPAVGIYTQRLVESLFHRNSACLDPVITVLCKKKKSSCTILDCNRATPCVGSKGRDSLWVVVLS